MKYKNSDHFDHQQQQHIGVLITNLGTPDEPSKPALKRYLKEFLSDPRVVEFPRLLWLIILHCVILRIRPAKSAHAYQTVWTDQGSPLLTISEAQQSALRQALNGKAKVFLAMRYGNPSMSETLQSMFDQGVRKLLVVPLYPQYCAATTASTFDALAADFSRRRWLPELRFISHYHDHSAYIAACVDAIKNHWQEHGRYEQLLFSYHGIPQRYLTQGDPYFCECHKTTRLIGQALGLSESEYTMTFQSRFGREQWLQPYTDATLKDMAAQGVKSVQVFCPGFSADCLETIEEINVENRGYFIDAGGERFDYIPALNDNPAHIEALKTIIEENLSNWRDDNSDRKMQSLLATNLGAKQ